MTAKRKASEDLSLEKEIELYGVKIRKMPNGQYFKALRLLKELPGSFMKELLEENKELRLSDMFDIENLGKLIGTLLVIAPDFFIRFLAELLDIKKEVLEKELNPTQTIEIAKKFWEINELESFFDQLKLIMKGIATKIGFSEQLPSALKSE